MKFLKKPFVFAVIYSLLLMMLSIYILLDAFIIPRELPPSAENEGYITANETFSFSTHAPSESETDDESIDKGDDLHVIDSKDETLEDIPPSEYPIITNTTYEDENIRITIETVRIYETEVNVADVVLSSAEYFKTAIAKDKFGTNICEKTSVMAENNNAIFAVNGDYYGADKRGFVIKNGVLYRESARSDSKYDDLIVNYDGSFEKINEEEISANDLLNNGTYQLFAFGPFLVENSELTVNTDEEVGQAMSSNPRTAVGMVSPLHYKFVVSDGRTSESKGLSLYQLASFMQDQGCTVAYNLDGGGSSTMYFNGRVVNKPVQMKNKISEREVSDIVYIGY